MKSESAKSLQATYLQLINITLPQTFSYPVKQNHCFGRIVLDWIFNDCWYHHLTKNVPAYRQLTTVQLTAAVERMRLWLQHPVMLVEDNNRSLYFRNKQNAQR